MTKSVHWWSRSCDLHGCEGGLFGQTKTMDTCITNIHIGHVKLVMRRSSARADDQVFIPYYHYQLINLLDKTNYQLFRHENSQILTNKIKQFIMLNFSIFLAYYEHKYRPNMYMMYDTNY